MMKDDEDEDEVMKRSDFISSCLYFQTYRAWSMTMPPTLPMIAMMHTACVTFVTLG
jgi:hypothetical protein